MCEYQLQLFAVLKIEAIVVAETTDQYSWFVMLTFQLSFATYQDSKCSSSVKIPVSSVSSQLY